jgi:general secretion pathway protein H
VLPLLALNLSQSVIQPTVSRIRGFTLIEILVVLVIMGIVATSVSLSFTRDESALLSETSDRLALLLQSAHDDAILTGKPIAWSEEGGSYQFWRPYKDEWKPIETDELFHQRQLPERISMLELRINNTALKPGELLVFAPGGLATPFEATLAFGPARSKIQGDAAGRVRVVQLERTQ